jgi:predicted membrane protein
MARVNTLKKRGEKLMTLEEFYLKEKMRFKRLVIGTVIFLSIMIPVGFYGSKDRLELYLSVVLSMMATGTLASWVAYSELKKAVKKNRSIQGT